MVREDAAKDMTESNLFGMVTQDAHYEEIKKEIFSSLDRAFNEVKKYAEDTLPPYLQIYKFNECLDVEAFKSEKSEDMRKMLAKFKEEEEKFKTLQETKDLGIFRLDSTELKNKLKVSPSNKFKEFEKMMPDLTYGWAKDLIKKLEEAEETLNKKPDTVQKYTEYFK